MLGDLVAEPCPLLAGRLGGACIAPLLVTPSPRSRKLLHPSPALPSSEPSRNYRIWQAACLITHLTRMGYAYKVGNQVGTPCYMSKRFFLTCCFPKASPWQSSGLPVRPTRAGKYAIPPITSTEQRCIPGGLGASLRERASAFAREIIKGGGQGGGKASRYVV